MIRFYGANGTDLSNEGARISAEVDGDPFTSGDTTDLPTRLVFSTTSDSASSPTERLRITSDAYVRLASGTGGIQFNGDTAAANALDDYEEGTWTPVLRFGGASTGITSTVLGTYTKVGNLVYFFGSINLSNKGSATGDVSIGGLPFTASGTDGLFPNATPRAVNALTFTAPLYAGASRNTTNIFLLDNNSGSQRALTNTAFANNTELAITGFYYV
jgi:hypothetical protein